MYQQCQLTEAGHLMFAAGIFVAGLCVGVILCILFRKP